MSIVRLLVVLAIALFSACEPLAAQVIDRATSKRGEAFDRLRSERLKTLKAIDAKNDLIKAIDKKLATLRSELGFPNIGYVGGGVSNYSSPGDPSLKNSDASRRLKALRVELDSAELLLGVAKEAAAREGVPADKLQTKPDVAEAMIRVNKLRNDIDAAEELHRQALEDDKKEEERRRLRDEGIQRDQKEAQARRKTAEKNLNDLVAEQDGLRLEVTELSAQLDEINFSALRLIDGNESDGWFRIQVSWIFGALICALIVGFFWVTINDRDVRYEIFAFDSGIQFVTLFAIVIAVILFGIMGVLEGRELAALLAGLSGYILGRTNLKNIASSAEKTVPAASPSTPAPAAGP